MEVRGHSWETNLPARRLIYTRDLYEPVQELAGRIVAAARAVLESTPPELAADISSTGVLLTGGGSLLRGLASYLAGELHVDVAIAPDPINCVARGTDVYKRQAFSCAGRAGECKKGGSVAAVLCFLGYRWGMGPVCGGAAGASP